MFYVSSPYDFQHHDKFVLCVQEVVTHFYIVSYFIKWVTTSWTYGTWPGDRLGILGVAGT